MGKLKTLNINQTSTELVSVDDIDRLALLISNNELNSTAILFIEELIKSEGYIDLRDLMDDEYTITFKGCLNTPTNIAYKDALDVLLAHGVTNECADTYIRVYTLLLEILKNADGATDGKGISLTIADTLTSLDLTGTELKEFQSIHDAYNALTRINLSYTNVEGDVDVDKYTNLELINTRGSSIDNIDGLTNKASLRQVNYNTPNKIEISDDDLLTLSGFSGRGITSREINAIASDAITVGKDNINIYTDAEELTVLDKANLDTTNAGIVSWLGKVTIENADKLAGVKAVTGLDTYPWVIEASETYGFDSSTLMLLYTEFPDIEYVFTEEKTPILKSTGTQYIKLSDSFSEFYVKAKLATDSSDHAFVFGSGQWSGGVLLIHSPDGGGSDYTCYNSTCVFGKRTVQVMSDVEFNMTGSYSTNSLFLMGGCNSENGGIWCSKFMIYESDKTTLRYFLIPFYRDEQYGMLDLVSNIFYSNSGSGTFNYELK